MPPADRLGCAGLWLGNSGLQCHLNPKNAACSTIRIRSAMIRDQLQLDADVPTGQATGKPKEGIECPMPASGTHPDCQCPTGQRYDATSRACKAAGSASPQSGGGTSSANATRRDQERMKMIMGILLLNEHHKLGLDIKAHPSAAKQK